MTQVQHATKDQMSIVYVLSNPAFDILKIGKTTNLDERLRTLNNTSVPFPFRVEFAIEVNNDADLEGSIHKIFSDHRVNPKREFFDIGLSQVIAAMKLTGGRDVTPNSDLPDDEESVKAVSAQRTRKANKSFGKLDISTGTTLAFMGKQDVTAEVLGDKMVLFEGKEMSVSASALIVLNRDGKTWTDCNGWQYWTLNDEALSERAKRFELSSTDM